MTQSVALQQVPLDGLGEGAGGNQGLSRVQSTERDLPTTKIDMLHQNLQKLERLERRLMRGRGHRKKSTAAAAGEAWEASKGKGPDAAQRKSRKKGKNWRFAYDLYCKELISSNQPQPSTQRSVERLHDASSKTGAKAVPTTLARHTSSNATSRREQILRHIAANNGGAAYLGGNAASDIRSGSSRGGSQNTARRLVQTATDSFGTRHKARRSHARGQSGSRISTAGAADPKGPL